MWNDLESIGYVTPAAAPPESSAFERQRPSPEFMAALFALQTCDHVHLYGFHQRASNTYWGAEPTPSTQRNWPPVTYFILMHISIWPQSDAFRGITVHK